MTTEDDCLSHFYCRECHGYFHVKDKGKATKEGKPYEACINCCLEEQKRQFYAEM
ncbi:hypothetical protein LCGC14_1188260 [marine sediment metagenome]|uniref:Uncharacterized protein n=1 Tax=marine sediment metagenome TaxID=412755 RepID=A0A0F9LK77_9ZZZZ